MLTPSLHYNFFACCVIFYYMYNKFKKGLIGNNAYLNWKTYIKKVGGAYAYRRVDNTMDDTTETNLANKYAKALVKDMDKHKQLKGVLYVRLGMSILKQANG